MNRYRRTKRLVSLDEEGEDGAQFAAPDPEPLRSTDSRLESSTDAALAALSSEDRLVLAAYYLDGHTLAEIARMLGVHESTVSRKVDKLAKSLRKKILAGMMQKGMARRQAEEALEVDVRDLQVDIRRSLTQESAAATFSEKKEALSLQPKGGAKSEKLEARNWKPPNRSELKCEISPKSCERGCRGRRRLRQSPILMPTCLPRSPSILWPPISEITCWNTWPAARIAVT